MNSEKAIKLIKELRDACDRIITAYDKNDEAEFEAAAGSFVLLILNLMP